jgi:hypothetical protein
VRVLHQPTQRDLGDARALRLRHVFGCGDPRRPGDRHRVDVVTEAVWVLTDLEVQVSAGRVSGASDLSDLLTDGDLGTSGDGHHRQVRVEQPQPTGLNLHMVAV